MKNFNVAYEKLIKNKREKEEGIPKKQNNTNHKEQVENILKSQQQFYAETNQQQYHYPYTNRPVIWHNSTRSANIIQHLPNHIMLHQPSLQQLQQHSSFVTNHLPHPNLYIQQHPQGDYHHG